MAILKNEPVFNFEDGDYCKPHHIIVEGKLERDRIRSRDHREERLRLSVGNL